MNTQASRVGVIASLVLAACSSAYTPPPCVATANETAAAQKEIEEAAAQFGRALIRGDAASVASLYTPDALLISQGDDLLRGRAAIQSSMQAWLATVKITDWVPGAQEVLVYGDTASRIGTATGTWVDGSTVVTTTFRYIHIWKRQSDGSWRLSREVWNTNPPKHAATSLAGTR